MFVMTILIWQSWSLKVTEAILLYQIIIIIFLIILSAFFSSSETAITSISEDVLQKKVEENDHSSIRTQKLLKKK